MFKFPFICNGSSHDNEKDLACTSDAVRNLGSLGTGPKSGRAGGEVEVIWGRGTAVITADVTGRRVGITMPSGVHIQQTRWGKGTKQKKKTKLKYGHAVTWKHAACNVVKYILKIMQTMVIKVRT